MMERVYGTDEEAAQALAARQSIRATMERMLDGSVSYLEGSRIIARTRFDAGLEWDPDIIPFVGAASETEALPLGDERKFWSAAALEGLQPKIIEAEGWAKGLLEAHCRNLVQRFLPVISADEALKLIKRDKHLENLEIIGELVTFDSEGPEFLWSHVISINNCVIHSWIFTGLQATKPVIIRNSHFKNTDGFAPYFFAGLDMQHCVFDSYLDFQCGIHNKKGSAFRLEGNTFKSFVNFFDCWFEGPVILKNNDFEKATNLMSKSLMIQFDVPPEIEGNLGQLDLEDEKDELR